MQQQGLHGFTQCGALHRGRARKKLTPAFHGCYDWQSSVHGHWLLARSLTAANLKGELAYLEGKERAGFERPYGLAWLLQLAAELREWEAQEAQSSAAQASPRSSAPPSRA